MTLCRIILALALALALAIAFGLLAIGFRLFVGFMDWILREKCDRWE